MSRLVTVVRAFRELRRPADLAALRAAGSPAELARLALIPAGRNLGVAICLLRPTLRAEATAALLGCRVLDAYEDLAARDIAPEAVRAAAAYLAGANSVRPPAIGAIAARDSEAVDLLLADRVEDIRELIASLPSGGQERVGRMLVDVGDVMATNLVEPLSRVDYSEGVLGRVTLYASMLVVDCSATADNLREQAGCVGIAAQLANDLRDGEFAPHGVATAEELTRVVMLRLLAPTLGALALLEHLGAHVGDRGARAAISYMSITTTAFLCGAVGEPGPYPRRRQLGAALLATRSATAWSVMLRRLGDSADRAIHRMLDAQTRVDAGFAPPPILRGDTVAGGSGVGALIVDTTFCLVRELPSGQLAGELSDADVRRMMIADHLVFGALDRLPLRDARAIGEFASKLTNTALDNITEGVPL